ncbi:MAG: Maf family nucleotide pyrophosphatase [Muribaculaceae bacterium]|nr:Maf family nucleotide pyrophosphatase [Muribaculaceae bacterium]
MPLPFGLRPVLASNSPRRRELLGMMVPGFRMAAAPDVDEKYPADLPHREVPAYLSRLKAAASDHSELAENEVLVTADTVVLCDGLILGKPHSREEAIAMLERLSGRSHEVVTGVTLSNRSGRLHTFSETTKVRFADIRPEDIRTYVDIFEPYDKAGAYGIQEWIGAVGIRGVEGCFYNVMGLPLSALYRELASFA